MDSVLGRKTIGIIGGGQLGRMLIQAGINYPLDFHIYSDSENFSSKGICTSYTIGDLNDYQKIVEFGRKCDIITIEIENVNIEALEYLCKLNKCVYPQPEILELVKDRVFQKDFLMNLDKKIKTLNYISYNNIYDLMNKMDSVKVPFVNKIAIGGYDGYGTKIIRNDDFINDVFTETAIIEEYCQIDRELSVIVARNIDNNIVIYPPVEMVFNDQNMLDYLICPAKNVNMEEINYIANTIVNNLDLIGIIAIELFESNGKLYVNELAPRPHNSGHHTQDMFNYSQYDILIRCLLNLPLPNLVAHCRYGACLNILGNGVGNALYNRLNRLGDTHIHLYDKKVSKPYRKMGHLNIISNDYDDLLLKIGNAKSILETCISINNEKVIKTPVVGVIMGSISDLSVMNSAIDILKKFKIEYEVKIVSAHRTPELMFEYAKTAHQRGLKIIIAGAGGSAHLAGMVASSTSLPVIGVPIKSSNSIDGWDSILSTLQMPNGIPVGTVNLNGSENAGLLAVRILGYTSEMDDYREELREKVREMNENIMSL